MLHEHGKVTGAVALTTYVVMHMASDASTGPNYLSVSYYADEDYAEVPLDKAKPRFTVVLSLS